MENNENDVINNVEVQNEAVTPEVVDTPKKKKKKKKVGKIIFNIMTFILFVVIVLEAAIGIINMQKINNNEEPVWYLTKNKTETDLKTVTEYHLGLYKIVKTDTSKESKTTLIPFFLGD